MDALKLEEAKKFLAMPEKKRRALASFDDKCRLIQELWDQWQSEFMAQDKDREVPFIRGLFVKRNLKVYARETWEVIRGRLKLPPLTDSQWDKIETSRKLQRELMKPQGSGTR